MMGTDYAPRCTSCPDCGTTLDTHPDDHAAPEPHDFGPWEWDVDAGTGVPWQVRRCQRFGCRANETRSAEEANAERLATVKRVADSLTPEAPDAR